LYFLGNSLALKIHQHKSSANLWQAPQKKYGTKKRSGNKKNTATY